MCHYVHNDTKPRFSLNFKNEILSLYLEIFQTIPDGRRVLLIEETWIMTRPKSNDVCISSLAYDIQICT